MSDDEFAEIVRSKVGEALFSLSPDGDTLPISDEDQFGQTVEGLLRTIAYLAVLRRIDGHAVDYPTLAKLSADRLRHYTALIEASWPGDAVH